MLHSRAPTHTLPVASVGLCYDTELPNLSGKGFSWVVQLEGQRKDSASQRPTPHAGDTAQTSLKLGRKSWGGFRVLLRCLPLPVFCQKAEFQVVLVGLGTAAGSLPRGMKVRRLQRCLILVQCSALLICASLCKVFSAE